jgi:hypothetical protein
MSREVKEISRRSTDNHFKHDALRFLALAREKRSDQYQNVIKKDLSKNRLQAEEYWKGAVASFRDRLLGGNRQKAHHIDAQLTQIERKYSSQLSRLQSLHRGHLLSDSEYHKREQALRTTFYVERLLTLQKFEHEHTTMCFQSAYLHWLSVSASRPAGGHRIISGFSYAKLLNSHSG